LPVFSKTDRREKREDEEGGGGEREGRDEEKCGQRQEKLQEIEGFTSAGAVDYLCISKVKLNL
jgi:hypothetical protein